MPIDLPRELIELRRAILTMGSLVEQRVEQVIRALLEFDVSLAEAVRRGDREIDVMDVDIETECLRILALSQPMATDLRFVLSVMRINTDLERIGDEAKSIAKRVIDMAQFGPSPLPPSLTRMADASRRMLSDALTALAEEDTVVSRRVRRADQQVDDLQKEIFVWVQEEIPAHVEATPMAINILSVARRLERIADLSTNIAEDVIFLAEGSLVRHEKG